MLKEKMQKGKNTKKMHTWEMEVKKIDAKKKMRKEKKIEAIINDINFVWEAQYLLTLKTFFI